MQHSQCVTPIWVSRPLRHLKTAAPLDEVLHLSRLSVSGTNRNALGATPNTRGKWRDGCYSMEIGSSRLWLPCTGGLLAYTHTYIALKSANIIVTLCRSPLADVSIADILFILYIRQIQRYIFLLFSLPKNHRIHQAFAELCAPIGQRDGGE